MKPNHKRQLKTFVKRFIQVDKHVLRAAPLWSDLPGHILRPGGNRAWYCDGSLFPLDTVCAPLSLAGAQLGKAEGN